VLEYDQEMRLWDKYSDPNSEIEIVLLKEHGVTQGIVTVVSCVDNILLSHEIRQKE
jgi:hypothetical protein